MKKVLIVLLVVVSFVSCKKDKDKVVELENGTKYTFAVEFKGFWGEDTHPTDYPKEAKFGKVLMVSHGGRGVLFSEGRAVVPWFKEYLKTGKPDAFISYFEKYKEDGRVGSVVDGKEFGAIEQSEKMQIVATGHLDRLSFVCQLTPSPDWFIGFDALDLNSLALSRGVQYIVPVYDAGVFAGKSYAERGAETNENVSRKKDTPVVYPKGGVNKFAIITITREKIEAIKK